MKALHTLALAALCLLFASTYAHNNKDLTKFYIENRGQVKDEKGEGLSNTLFYLSGSDKQIFVTEKGYAIVHAATGKSGMVYNTINVKLDGATIRKENVIFGQGAQPNINFYNGSKVLEGVKASGIIIIKNIYPGIDWLWSVDANGNPKHEFMVNIGADASVIKYNVEGAKLSTKTNNIVYNAGAFGVQEGPVVFLTSGDDIAATLKTNGQQLSFSIPDQLKQGGFTIDPSISTLWGDTNSIGTEFNAIDVNDSMYTVTVGRSSNYLPVFPQVPGSYQINSFSSKDIVIMKTDWNQDLIWATYFGGVDDDGANGVAMSNNAVFVTGFSQSWDFPQNISGNYTHPVQLFGQDAFILKFDNLGKWKWGTGYGGSQVDEAFDIKYFGGRIYLAGYTYSADFPVLSKPGAYNNAFGPSSGNRSGFIAEFDELGNHLWATYYGADNALTGIDVDGSGIYTVGYGNSIPLQSNGAAYYQPVNKGQDGTVAAFSLAGALRWSTYFGSNGSDVASGIAHSTCGLFICGKTDSTGLPVLSQGNGNHYEATYGGGGSDGFVAKFDAASFQQRYTTYYGNAVGREVFTRLDINDACELVVTGYSDSTITNAGNPNRYFLQPTNYGQNDVMMVQFTAQQHVKWSSLFGRGGQDYGYDVTYALNSAIDMVGANLYNYGNYYIGGTYTTTPCASYYTCPRVTSNAVSNRFMHKDTMGVFLGIDTGSGGGSGGGSCGRPLFFHAMELEKNTCPNECNGRASMDTNNIVGCPPYIFLWSSGALGLVDTSLCEQYWSRVIDANGRRRTLYDRFNILRVPTSDQVETTCGEAINWLDYIHPTGGGPPYTVTFRGLEDSLCPTNAYFDVMDTAGCIVSHSLSWKRYNEGLFPGLYVDPFCRLRAYVDGPSTTCIDWRPGWNYVVIANGDTTRVPIYSTNATSVLLTVPDTNVLYSVYIDQGTCTGNTVQFFSQGLLKDTVDATLVCNGTLGELDVTVFTDTATLNYYGNYTLYVTISNDSGTVASVDTFIVSGTALDSYTFNFDSLRVDQYLITVYTSRQLNNSECNIRKHYFNLKSVDFTLNRAAVYCGVSDTLIATMTGGFAPYTYQWSHTVDNTPQVDVFTPGFYSLTVTDSKGCSFDSTIAVPGSPAIVIDDVQENLAPCDPGLFSTVSVNASGGTFPYSYTWNSGENQPVATSIPQGAGWVRVFDMFECSDTAYFVSTKQAGLEVDLTFDNVSCSGANDGSASIAITHGYLPYTIVWINGSAATSISGLQPGYYDYAVTDSIGCVVQEAFDIEEPPLLSFATQTGAATCDDSDGFAQIAAAGGTTPIDIQWFDGSTLFARNDLPGGTHAFVLTDDNGCTLNGGVTVDIISLLTAQIFKTDVVCSSDTNGSITVLPFNATSPVSFIWSSGDTLPFIANKPGGDYSVTITDAAGCKYEDTITIVAPPDLELTLFVQTPLLCYNDLATITVYANGGTPPYTGDVGNFTLGEGTYSYTIQDSKGCTVDTGITFVNPPEMTSTFIVTDVFCDSLGKIEVVTTGGIGTYTISDFGLSDVYNSTYTIEQLLPGNYSYDVFDSLGCYNNVSATVGGYTQPGAYTIVTDVSCHGLSDGKVEVIIYDGTAPLTVNGALFNNTYEVNGLLAGTYTYQVVDSAGCAVNINGVVNEPAALVVSVDTGTGISCTGSPAFVSIAAIGGTPPYTGVGNQNMTGGTYNVVVTDDRGCTANANFTLTDPIALQSVLTISQPDCDDSLGAIHISTQGGTGPYILDFDGNTYSYTDTVIVLSIDPDNYPIMVSDMVGCQEFNNAFIEIYSKPVATFSTSNVSCYGRTDGSVSINISQGVTPYYVNGNLFNNGDLIDTLAANAYEYIITDNSGCGSDTINFVIDEPDTLVASYTMVRDIVCAGDLYNIQIDAQGGTSPYIGVDTFNYAQGPFTQTVTDDNGCTASVSFTLTQPATFNVDFSTTNPNCSFGNGTFTAIATGGVGPYRVYNGTGSTSFTDTITMNVPSGTYTYEVFDSKNCRQLYSFIITTTNTQAAISMNDVACYGDSTGRAIIRVTGSNAQFTVNGITFTDSIIMANLPAGFHQFNVTDPSGCNFVMSGVVNQPTALILDSNMVTGGVTCFNRTDGSISMTANGGTPVYTYGLVRAPGDTLRQAGSSFSNIASGIYNVFVTDSNGCRATGWFAIDTFIRSVDSVSIDSIDCYGFRDGAIRVYPTPADRNPYTFSLNGGVPQVHNVFYGLVSGNYVIEVSDVNGCTDTVHVFIPQPDSIDGRVWLNGELLPVDSTLIQLRDEAVFTKENTLNWEIVFTPDLHPVDASDTMMVFKPRDPASYTVYVYQDSIGSSCFKQYTGFIDVEPVPLLPDIITPNGDGFNDMWAIDLDKYGNSKVIIFDRWGAIVYETDAYQNEWNGTYQKSGEKVADGTYFYLLTPNGQTTVLKGAINVLNSNQ